jgi:glycine oxidase
MTDCCIIGGGVVGLSIARELAGRGASVRVLARGTRRDTASWAAVGIFPPAPAQPGCPPNAALTAWSDRLHRRLAVDLLAETGIDNGLRQCGGLHVAADAAGLERLRASGRGWRDRGAACQDLDGRGLAACEPALAGAVDRGAIVGGLLLPEEQSLRSPRHLAALEESCRLRGVVVTRGAEVRAVARAAGMAESVAADVGGVAETVRAATFVLAAGAWTESLAGPWGLRIATRPIRGQIVMLELPRQPLSRIVNHGLDYLVPRDDGRLLVGSTLEDVGFAPTTTADAISRLRGLARSLLGDLARGEPAGAWAGLRPGSADGLPTIGPVPGLANAFVAAGHFRAGLHQSTGTAVMLADLVTGVRPAIDPAPFAADRPPAPANDDSVAAYLARVAAESA